MSMARYRAAVGCALLVGVAATGGASSTNAAPTPVGPASVPATTVERTACVARTEVEAWPLRDRASNLLMVGVPISEAPAAVALVTTEGLGGILIRGTPSKTSGPALRAIRDAGRHGPAFVAVDEEGGRVQHLRTAIGPLPTARSTPKTRTTAQYRAAIAAHGRAMRALGLTMNLAPDVDVDSLTAGPDPVGANGIGDRSYSANPVVVADYGRAFALGMLDAGIVPVLKHFPGHGRASGDSHNIGASTPSLTSMRASDLVPFATILADRRVGVMTAHLYVPGLDTYPASLSSRAVTDLLRGEFGDRGLIVTDSLSMWPIRYYYRAPDAAVLALRAGNDVLLYDDRPAVPAVIDGLVAAMTKDEKLAALAVDANLRILAAKGRTLCDQPTPTPSTIVIDTTVSTTSTTVPP